MFPSIQRIGLQHSPTGNWQAMESPVLSGPKTEQCYSYIHILLSSKNDYATAQRFIYLLGAHRVSDMDVCYCLLHPFILEDLGIWKESIKQISYSLSFCSSKLMETSK